METFGALLQPHSLQLQQLVIILSGLKLLRYLKLVQLLKLQTCSDSLSLKSLLGSLILVVLGMRLAQLSENPMMLHINSMSLLLNLIFLAILYCYASPNYKSSVCRKLLSIIIVMVLCLWYSHVEDAATVKCFLSIVRTGTTSLLIVMGLWQGTGAVLGCFMSMLLATSKLLYAISMLNTFMLYQSLFVFCLDLLRIYYALHDLCRRRGCCLLPAAPNPCKHTSTVELRSASTMGLMGVSTVSLGDPSTVDLRGVSTVGLQKSAIVGLTDSSIMGLKHSWLALGYSQVA